MAGDLDREIELQTATKTQDTETGEEVLTWPVTATIWAQWLPANTREAYVAQQRLQAYIDGVFRIWWRSDVTPDGTRIVYDGRTFDVKPVIEGGRRVYLDIPVVARA